MRPLLLPARRVTEASPAQIVATGATLGGAPGVDPIDGDTGYASTSGNRETPGWTREKARTYSIAAYRSNPMARAIIDTYTAFAVGDSGVTYQCSNAEVGAVVAEFWNDPRNRLADIQELWLRSLLLMGEDCTEMLVGKVTGTTRFSPIDPSKVDRVELTSGNPLWPAMVHLSSSPGSAAVLKTIVAVDDMTDLRDGEVQWWAPFRTLITDTRGMPFMTPILDQLDAYDTVISNLIDRTALARYLVWDVTVKGSQEDVDRYVAARKGTHIPPSGSVEVHNDAVAWEPKTAQSGAEEDSVAGKTVLTELAAGAGLAKTWLAEPEDANRATSLSMAEPVRRRVAGVQRIWLACQTELVRFAVDRAVAAGRLPAMVSSTDPRTGEQVDIPASQTVIVTGPEVAAADAQITAQMILNLSTGLKQMVESNVLSVPAAKVAARKAWEQFVGIPYQPDLDKPDAAADDVATAVQDAQRRPLRAVT